jgi:hypothetical protein
MASVERLRGLMINVGAKGGTVMVRGGGTNVVKSMTAYWDAARPDFFGSLMVDFAHPLPGGAGGVTIQIVDADAVPTEPTLHSKPIIPGRYGEIEIEGALLIECDKMQYDYIGPTFGWLPLDLCELPEARQLRERLTNLGAACPLHQYDGQKAEYAATRAGHQIERTNQGWWGNCPLIWHETSIIVLESELPSWARFSVGAR